MAELQIWQIFVTALLFIWSGFVRSGLGFGGAALTLPLLLMVENNPLLFLPIIAVHLLIFSAHTIRYNVGEVNWPYLKKLLAILAIPKVAGIVGLLSLPADVMSGFVYLATLFYAFSYVFCFEPKGGKYTDVPLLMAGGYLSGASLIGAPLIVAVATRHLAANELRTTLFVLWFVLVCVKLAAFIAAGVELQLLATVFLLPFAALGHWGGLHLNRSLVSSGRNTFIRVIGIVLVIISGLGLARLALQT